jgi:hypothetical protein
MGALYYIQLYELRYLLIGVFWYHYRYIKHQCQLFSRLIYETTPPCHEISQLNQLDVPCIYNFLDFKKNYKEIFTATRGVSFSYN